MFRPSLRHAGVTGVDISLGISSLRLDTRFWALISKGGKCTYLIALFFHNLKGAATIFIAEPGFSGGATKPADKVDKTLRST